MTDNHTPEQRRKNMQAIRSSGSLIEVILRKELWKRGLHYRKNCKDIPGKPDIVFKSKKVAVFCDSEFWHGYDWEKNKNNIKTNQTFWIEKIENNIRRDDEVNKILKENGWTVLRFWGKDIKSNTEKCADIIEKSLKEDYL